LSRPTSVDVFAFWSLENFELATEKQRNGDQEKQKNLAKVTQLKTANSLGQVD